MPLESTIVCSRECFTLLNRAPFAGPVPLEEVWSILHLEDIEGAKRALNQCIATNTLLEHISRCILPDGSIRVFHTRGIPYTDAYGHVVRVVGFNHDITEQTRIEDDLRRLSRQLLTLRSEEQRRVARELHETASQTLTALKMTLRQIGDLLPASDSGGKIFSAPPAFSLPTPSVKFAPSPQSFTRRSWMRSVSLRACGPMRNFSPSAAALPWIRPFRKLSVPLPKEVELTVLLSFRRPSPT